MAGKRFPSTSPNTGDPLVIAHASCAVQRFLETMAKPWVFNLDVLAGLEPLFAIPLQGIDWREGIP